MISADNKRVTENIAAKMLGIASSTLYAWHKKGKYGGISLAYNSSGWKFYSLGELTRVKIRLQEQREIKRLHGNTVYTFPKCGPLPKGDGANITFLGWRKAEK